MLSVQNLYDEAQGAEYVTYKARIGSRTITVEALADPLQLGLDGFLNIFEDPVGFRAVLSEKTRNQLMFLFPSGNDIVSLLKGWLEATGITQSGFAVLAQAMEHLDLVEADFQRVYGLALSDWFVEGSGLTTRRVATLTLDLVRRTDSSFGAELSDIDPMSKLEIMFAQFYGGFAEGGKPHGFLTSRKDAREEAEAEERKQRMLKRGLSA